jgi:hypothetical protein
MKAEHYATGAFILVLLGALYMIIREGRRLLDIGIGDNPLGAVGGDDFSDPENYPGWLTRFYAWQSGNPEAGTFGTEKGSVWDWNPFEGRWGIFGSTD